MEKNQSQLPTHIESTKYMRETLPAPSIQEENVEESIEVGNHKKILVKRT